MASCYIPWWKRNIAYKIPGLYKKCPQGNYHLRWDRLCFCGMNEHYGNWHGGILDLKTGKEYQPCEYCEKAV